MRDTRRGVSAHSCLRNYYVKVQASNVDWSKEQQSGLRKDKAGHSEWRNLADYFSGARVEGGKTSKQCSLWLHLKAKLSLTGWGRCELSMSAGCLWEGVQAATVCPKLFFCLSLQTFCGLCQKNKQKKTPLLLHFLLQVWQIYWSSTSTYRHCCQSALFTIHLQPLALVFVSKFKETPTSQALPFWVSASSPTWTF